MLVVLDFLGLEQDYLYSHERPKKTSFRALHSFSMPIQPISVVAEQVFRYGLAEETHAFHLYGQSLRGNRYGPP